MRHFPSNNVGFGAVAAGHAYLYLEESPTFTLPNRLSVLLVARKHGVGASQLFN
jgi:hypothetical protein